jgi:hypothetical protein
MSARDYVGEHPHAAVAAGYAAAAYYHQPPNFFPFTTASPPRPAWQHCMLPG